MLANRAKVAPAANCRLRSRSPFGIDGQSENGVLHQLPRVGVLLAVSWNHLVLARLGQHIDRPQLLACDLERVRYGHAGNEILDYVTRLRAGLEVNMVHDPVAMADYQVDSRLDRDRVR